MKKFLLFSAIITLGLFACGCAKQVETMPSQMVSEYQENKFIIAPASACNYLSNVNLGTQGYKDDGMGGYFCISQSKMLAMPSNITYSVEGSQTEAQRLQLVLNVHNNSTSNKQALLNELINDSKLLAKSALDYELSNNVINALNNGSNYTEQYNGYILETYKDTYVTGNGYSMQFTIKK